MMRRLVYIALLWVVFFAGCAGGAKSREEDEVDAGEDDDIWYTLESAEKLNGEWRGSGVLDVPADESRGFPETVFNLSASLNCTELYVVQRVKISFGDFLADLLASRPDSVFTIDELWEKYFENIYADYDLVREEYALVIENSLPAEELLNSGTDRLYINQDGTRLREFVKGGMLGGLLEPFGVSGSVDFVLEKL